MHTGCTLDDLSTRDLCDYVEFSLVERLNPKQEEKLYEQLGAAHARFRRLWDARYGVRGNALAATRGIRQLLPPQANGMAVGHSLDETE